MKRFIWRLLPQRHPLLCMTCLVLLTNGCDTLNRSAYVRSTTGVTRTNSQRSDSTYLYVRDSVVVYTQCTMGNTQCTMGNTQCPASSRKSVETTRPAPPQVSSPYIERWHTEQRERVVTNTDTIYHDRELEIQLPPERYVPRAVKVLAWTGGAAILLVCLWGMRRICKCVNL